MLLFPVMFEILYGFITKVALNFFTYRHIHSFIHHHNFMKLCGHGKREAVDEKLTFLFGALGGVTFQAVGNITEIGFPRAVISKGAGQFVLLVTAEAKFGFVISTQQIGVDLFADYLVGDGKFGLILR